MSGGLISSIMKKIIIFSIILIFQINLFSQKWQNTYGHPETNESFRDLTETYDHGYLISSSYELMDATWLIKTDINGDILWEKYLSWDVAFLGMADIYQSPDGNIVIASAVNGSFTGFWPIITKLDSCGDKLWCRVFQDDNFTNGWFDDVLILDNGDILALAYLHSDLEYELVFLFYIDANGNLLWKKSYANQFDHPHIRSSNGDDLRKYGNNYMINGRCYYPYPSDTTHFFLRPLYIMIDSLFNEQWIIPFGVNDSILGEGLETYQINDSLYMGLAMRRLADNVEHSLLIYFDDNGNELSYVEIPNDSIGPNISQNYINDIERINDSLFLASISVGVNNTVAYWGELIIDTSGKIYKQEFRPPNTSGWSTLVKTFDNKFVIGTSWSEGKADKDIYMYKIDEDLEHDTLYPGNYNYDSLCPYQIESGIIDISNCLIITDVKETPTPNEYFASLQSIAVKAYPNPVKDGSITFEFLNTEYHKDIRLTCFDIFGKEVNTEKVYQHQGELKLNVSQWSCGIYFVIVYSDGKAVGECKFVVQ